MGVHGTCGLNNPWHHLRNMEFLVDLPTRSLVDQQDEKLKTSIVMVVHLDKSENGVNITRPFYSKSTKMTKKT